MGTTGQSITLANSIIGVGILAMPFCFQQCGVLLATLLLLLMGFISRLCCHFLLKSAIITRRRTFEFLAFHVFGPAGKLAVEVGIIGFLMGTCIAYFVVVGDLGPQIIAKMLNINQSDILRTSIMVIVSLVCVLPLGLLRNVDSLSNVSAATICFYFCLVIKVILEATSQLLTADWHRRIEMWKPSGVLQCVPIFSMALFCQTQLFEIFESLPSLSLEKMNVVTKNAINICTAVYFTLGFFGYVAFSSHNISGNILMSLSPTFASDIIKLGFVMSLAFSFPLIIFPCRASLYSFLYKKVHPAHHDHIINHSIPETTFRCITVAIIAVALFISLLLPNIELVLGLLGSTIGVLVCVVFPAACFINVTFKNTNERLLAKVILVFGLIILVLGTYANLQAAESKYDDKYITQERIDKMVEDFFEKMDKNEGGKPKAEVKHDPIHSNLKEKADGEILKDSEIQPPNPIPPESHSNEKAPDNLVPIETKQKQVALETKPIKVAPDLVHERPKDIKIEHDDAKLINGDARVEPRDVNIDKSKELVKPESSQERIDIIKKQQLIETIKQHGEEQKELIKEQKEILHEILKTQKELEKDKKKTIDNEAKKIAVESIQKIANIAIQSLSGVTDKSVDRVDEVARKDEPLQKLANDAVQEIAKKAAETLQAIDKKKEPVESLLKPVQIKPDQNAALNNNLENKVKLHDSDKSPIKPSNDLKQTFKANETLNLNKVKQEEIEKNIIQNNQIAPQLLAEKSKKEVDKVQLKLLNDVDKQKLTDKEELNKGHSHAPDEPHSYKQGEDLINKNIKNSIDQNIPIAIALKGNLLANGEMQNGDKSMKKEIENKQNEAVNEKSVISQNGDVNKSGPSNVLRDNVNIDKPDDDKLARQKREVVDCTEKSLLKPEDKQICEKLIGDRNELPEAKLDVNLPLNQPLHYNIIHRSLKNYNEEDRLR